MNKDNNERNANNTNQTANDDHQTDKLVDLPVSDEQAGETKGGGLLLPAVQASREAARRSS